MEYRFKKLKNNGESSIFFGIDTKSEEETIGFVLVKFFEIGVKATLEEVRDAGRLIWRTRCGIHTFLIGDNVVTFDFQFSHNCD